ncbi:2OG-Fe(II) oxygenase family protein [Glaciecola siphonariae]|uniref:2OG-Fe(II) oxygenase family protein n=1 Tax=Glaciecola siphonariae TaxID=521012 RepID=A0ABV9LTL1_9ALTE
MVLNQASIKWMQQGLQFHRAGDFSQAKLCYDRSLREQASNYETLQLYGALLHKAGQYEKAIDLLLASLSIEPNQAHVLNTLGNAYKALCNVNSAREKYDSAIQMKPDYADPYINLCQLLIQQEQLTDASAYLIEAFKHCPSNWQLLRLQGLLQKAQGSLALALKSVERAKELAPNQAVIFHDLALLLRMMGRSNEAISHYKQLLNLGYTSEVFFHNYANALSDVSQHDLALEYYSKALSINPTARDTLLNWCDLMWESGQGDKMFAAYEVAMKRDDIRPEVISDYIKKLLRTNNIEAARVVFSRSQDMFPAHPLTSVNRIALSCYTKTGAETIKLEDLSTQLKKICREPLVDLNDKLSCIEYALEKAAFETAYNELIWLQRSHPNDQWLLALLHTCQRVLPDKTYSFKDVENYVFEYQISPPSGSSLTEYLQALKVHLLSLHQSKEQPLEQTLHHGTQTRGNLFAKPHPLVAHIMSEYRQAVVAYKHALSKLPELYPGFWQEKPFTFSGSWSVALRQSGFHNNHIHPMGWLSSACYISLPDFDQSSNAGYFQVGIPNLANDGLGLPALKEVMPQEGKLVLFPSMLWHGTVPFKQNELRLSIACDIVYTDKEVKD